jgi:hypothetical protein
MASKTSKKKVVKLVKRQPSPAAILKKVGTVSDSNKALQKEIKVMTKIFGENQKSVSINERNDRYVNINIRTHTKAIKNKLT